MTNYKKIIEDIYFDLKNIEDVGKVANYIPELGDVSPDNFGINITTINKQSFGVGNSREKFSIQSISKILTLALAYKIEGEKLWERVDVEPSGNPFNSLLQLETDLGNLEIRL
jgi:glutaminase